MIGQEKHSEEEIEAMKTDFLRWLKHLSNKGVEAAHTLYFSKEFTKYDVQALEVNKKALIESFNNFADYLTYAVRSRSADDPLRTSFVKLFGAVNAISVDLEVTRQMENIREEHKR